MSPEDLLLLIATVLALSIWLRPPSGERSSTFAATKGDCSAMLDALDLCINYYRSGGQVTPWAPGGITRSGLAFGATNSAPPEARDRGFCYNASSPFEAYSSLCAGLTYYTAVHQLHRIPDAPTIDNWVRIWKLCSGESHLEWHKPGRTPAEAVAILERMKLAVMHGV